MEAIPTPGICRLDGKPTAPGFYWHQPCLQRYRASVPYRQRTLARDGHHCAACSALTNRLADAVYAWRWRHSPRWLRKRIARQRPVDVDHVIPLALTGTHHPSNLQVLCARHHRNKTRHDLTQMRGVRTMDQHRAPGLFDGIADDIDALFRAPKGSAARGASRVRETGNPTTRRAGTSRLGWHALWWFACMGPALYALATSDAPRLGVAVVLGLALFLGSEIWLGWRAATRRVRARLWEAIAPTLGMPPTAHRSMKATRWRIRHIEDLRLPRLRPTRITIAYPQTFADHDPARQVEVEARIAAKCGSTWHAKWRTELDRVTLVSPDPLAGKAGLRWPAIDVERTSFWNPIPLGVGVDGQTVTAGLVGQHMLIGGETGAGKSVSLSEIVAWAALDPEVTMHGIDGKEMVELGPWEKSFTDLVGTTQSAIALLEEIVVLLDGRYEMLRMEGKRKVAPGDGMGLHLIVVDELARFTDDPDKALRERFITLLRDIISRGRAAGIIVVVATQRPSADVVPTRVRDLIGYRWALRCATATSSDMILGTGHASAGANAARIASESKGLGFLLSEGSAPVRLRSFLLTDDDVEALASRAAAVRGVVSGAEPEPWAADADQPSTST